MKKNTSISLISCLIHGYHSGDVIKNNHCKVTHSALVQGLLQCGMHMDQGSPGGTWLVHKKKSRLFTTYIGKLADSQSKNGKHKIYP